MNFLNPLFLLGLLAVAVPVVIHLINIHRPRTVAFSTLAFFRELQKSTLRRIRIKRYLLMALRAAAVLLLALALARPFLPPTLSSTSGSGEARIRVLLVDNSPSMSRVGPSGPLIDRAREVAGMILDRAGAGDQFMVATTNGEGRAGTLVNASRARELVNEIEPVPRGNYLPQVLEGIAASLEESTATGVVLYLISDGQASQFAGSGEVELGDHASDHMVIQPVLLDEADQQNVSIASVELGGQMVNQGSPVELLVDVRNEGDQPVTNQYLSLESGGEIRGEYEFGLQPGEDRTFSFDYIPGQTGDNTGRVMLEGDELAYDNVRHFVVRVPESRSVTVLRREGEGESSFQSYLRPALEAAQLTDMQLEVQLNTFAEAEPADWETSGVLVLDGPQHVPEYWFDALQRYVQEGGGLLFFPSEQGDVTNYNAFFELFNGGSYDDVSGTYASFESVAQMAGLVQGHPVLDDLFETEEGEDIRLDMPQIYYHYQYDEPSNTGSYVLLETEDGDPLFTEQRFGEGTVLISAIGSDPGWSNFPVSPLYAPFYYRSLLYAASGEQGGIVQHTLGRPFDRQTDLTGSMATLSLNDREARPQVSNRPEGMRLQYAGREWEPGILEIAAGEQTHRVAVNLDIMESRFATLGEQQLRSYYGEQAAVSGVISAEELSADQLDAQLRSAGFGREIWNWFVWAALLLLLTESLVSRLYRAETLS
ncbi:MAG: BatA domain-containing protein [Balneolaceae bacterium]|nr:BatA domain-containing protein [Balneolaceae bacterium]